jgi:predicted RNA-binding protein with PUA-like domain
VAHWLVKTEPTSFSIDDLERVGVEPWSGVRNFQARNHLRAMRVGDRCFFHHSSVKPPGIVGVCEVVREAYPDATQFDPGSPYHDPKATPDAPRWFNPDVRFIERFPRLLSMDELRTIPELRDMELLRRSRLSVQPVTDAEWDAVVMLAAQVIG